MNRSTLLNINAIVNMAAGIAFTLYGPLMMRLFGIPDIPSEDVLLYWNVAAFGRLFGATMFGFGLLIFSISRIAGTSQLSESSWRGIFLSLIFSNIILAITTITQQVSAWQSQAGWVFTAYFIGLITGYSFLLVHKRQEEGN